MRIRMKPAISISHDADGKYKLFAPDDTKVERVIDSYTKESSGVAHVNASATESLSLGDVTLVRGLWLSATKDCQVRINSASPALQLRKSVVAAGDDKAALVLEAEITSLEVIGGTEAVDITYVVWGDAA